MSLRLVATLTSPDAQRVAKVYRDVPWQEYRVRFFLEGREQIGADYHTEGKEDATQSALAWVSEEGPR